MLEKLVQDQVANCRSQIESLQETQKRLQELPQSLKNSSLQRYNSVAYFDATIYHTNEILVSIGNDFFVDRTAKQAHDIAQRRIEYFESKIDELKGKLKGNEQNMLKTSAQTGSILSQNQIPMKKDEVVRLRDGTLEIRENYLEEEQKVTSKSKTILKQTQQSNNQTDRQEGNKTVRFQDDSKSGEEEEREEEEQQQEMPDSDRKNIMEILEQQDSSSSSDSQKMQDEAEEKQQQPPKTYKMEEIMQRMQKPAENEKDKGKKMSKFKMQRMQERGEM